MRRPVRLFPPTAILLVAVGLLAGCKDRTPTPVASPTPEPVLADTVAAVVGDSIEIPRRELDAKHLALMERVPVGQLSTAKATQLRREALTGLVNRELLAREATKRGFHADTAAVTAELRRQQRALGDTAFAGTLRRRGVRLAEARAELVQESLLQQLLVERVFKRMPPPTAAQLDSARATLAQPVVEAYHLWLPSDASTPPSRHLADGTKAAALAARLTHGDPMPAIIDELSRQPDVDPRTIVTGTEIRRRSLAVYPPTLRTALVALGPSGVTRPIEMADGWHVLQLRRKFDAPVADAVVRERATAYLRSRAAAAFVDSLRRAADVIVNESILRPRTRPNVAAAPPVASPRP